MTDQVLPSTQAAVARPGDTLLLTCQERVTIEQANRIRDELMDRMPGVQVTIVSPMSSVTVYRPGATD